MCRRVEGADPLAAAVLVLYQPPAVQGQAIDGALVRQENRVRLLAGVEAETGNLTQLPATSGRQLTQQALARNDLMSQQPAVGLKSIDGVNRRFGLQSSRGCPA